MQKMYMNIGLSILREFVHGQTIVIDGERYGMSVHGEVGIVGETRGERPNIIRGDMTVSEFLQLVERHEVIPISK